VDELAETVRALANDVCWEMHRNYRQERSFRQTYREAYEMLTTASYIHELVHHNARRSRVQQEVSELDALFHHIEEDIATWRRFDIHDPYVASYHGHDHGQHLGASRLQRLMERMEETLHHLMSDVGYRSTYGSESAAPPQPRGLPPRADGFSELPKN
jgi:hypothetical protein